MAHSFALIFKTFFILFPLSSPVITSVRVDPNYKGFLCSTEKNSSTFFQNNVNLLSLDFNSKSSSQLYYNTSIGANPEYRVYGFYMCRGDLSLKDCHSCIVSATDFTRTVPDCGGTKALFSAEKCVYYCSDHSTYGDWRHSIANDDLSRGDPSAGYKNPKHSQFDRALNSTLESIIEEASKRWFATRETNTV